MVLTIKHRASYYKRFEIDIWGIMKTTPVLKPRLLKNRVISKDLEKLVLPNKKGSRPAPKRGWGDKEGKKRGLLRFKNRKNKSNKSRKSKDLTITEKFTNPEYRPTDLDYKLLYFDRSELNQLIGEKKGDSRASTLGLIPWHFVSNKIKRIMDFFFAIYSEQQERRMRSKQRFIYRIDIIKPREKRKQIKWDFITIRLVKLFYLTLTYRQFRRLASEMRRRDGCYEQNFCLALEGRLISAVYRTSLVANLFQCIQLVRSGSVAVNKRFQTRLNYRVQVAQVISFDLLTKRIIYLCLIKRLASKATAFNVPRYMFVSYQFILAFMKRPPLRQDLVFPIGVDMYRATGYAY